MCMGAKQIKKMGGVFGVKGDRRRKKKELLMEGRRHGCPLTRISGQHRDRHRKRRRCDTTLHGWSAGDGMQEGAQQQRRKKKEEWGMGEGRRK